MRRRDCLQLGVAGLAAGSFVNLLRMRQVCAAEAKPGMQAKRPSSCILIWMDGGPTHFETFDPKPDAPAEIRGEFRPISTNVPGIQICEHMPKLAAMADKYAIVRSVCHNQGNHGAGNHYMMTGAPPRIPVGCGAFVSFHPSMGSVAAKEIQAPHGLPSYFSMPNMARSGGPNFLGAKYAPFVVSNDPNHPNFRVRMSSCRKASPNRDFNLDETSVTWSTVSNDSPMQLPPIPLQRWTNTISKGMT